MRAGMDVRNFSARCTRDALDKTNDSNLDEDEKNNLACQKQESRKSTDTTLRSCFRYSST